jgi:biopolymer transport protein ExbD
MAQQIVAPSNGKSKKRSTAIDMTPLVDLGFLLVTFFILTSAYAKPQAMPLQMPKNQQNAKMPVYASGTISIFIGADDQVFYQQGLDKTLQRSNYAPEGIRKVLMDKKRQSAEKCFVVVKATQQAKYKNLIDLLDEIKVMGITNFAITDLNDADKALLAQQNVQ